MKLRNTLLTNHNGIRPTTPRAEPTDVVDLPFVDLVRLTDGSWDRDEFRLTFSTENEVVIVSMEREEADALIAEMTAKALVMLDPTEPKPPTVKAPTVGTGRAATRKASRK